MVDWRKTRHRGGSGEVVAGRCPGGVVAAIGSATSRYEPPGRRERGQMVRMECCNLEEEDLFLECRSDLEKEETIVSSHRRTIIQEEQKD